MDYWSAYDYIVNTVHSYMIQKNECLYNALVLTFDQISNDKLIQVRESLRALMDMINEELVTRQDRANEENDI